MSLLGKLIGAFAGTEQELPANAILIDVRSSGEYQAGYIAGAVSLPLGRRSCIQAALGCIPEESEHHPVLVHGSYSKTSALSFPDQQIEQKSRRPHRNTLASSQSDHSQQRQNSRQHFFVAPTSLLYSRRQVKYQTLL